MNNLKWLLYPASAATFAGCTPKTESLRPNIILILADDLGYGDVSAYGSTTIHTPHIDSLAQGGICFTNGYATSATSTPSRYALMTGMYPWKNRNAKILQGDAPLIIDEQQYTLPKMMQEAGYITGAIGKWHLGMGKGEVNWNEIICPGANQVGFDYSCLIAATNDRVPTVYVENGRVVGLEADDPIAVSYEHNFTDEPTALTHPELLKMQWAHGHNNSIVNGIPRIGYMKGGQKARWVDEEMADYFTGKVKQFITQNKERPFFLYFGLHQPHVPRTPNGRFVGSTGMGPRGDAIMEADWCVGEVVAHLRRQGLLENTLLIFTSDNGPVLNDGYKDQAVEKAGGHRPAGNLRGGKYSLYDAGTHVPFFVYWKDRIQPAVSDALVCQIDLMASLAALLRQPAPIASDSENLLDALTGKSRSGRKTLIVEAQGKLAIRKGEWILIPPYRGPETNLTGNELGNLPLFGLYNVKNDASQLENVAAVFPQKLEELKTDFFDITQGYYKADVEEVTLK
ncbi:MAG: arylsulfatase [Prevotella sp.]|jgi:arylsulfatase A-like enzyme|nr:arylsulfatase [Prevotella sp.]